MKQLAHLSLVKWQPPLWIKLNRIWGNIHKLLQLSILAKQGKTKKILWLPTIPSLCTQGWEPELVGTLGMSHIMGK